MHNVSLFRHFLDFLALLQCVIQFDDGTENTDYWKCWFYWISLI